MRGFLARMMPRGLGPRIVAALLVVGILPVLIAWAVIFADSRGPKSVDEHFLLLADYAAKSILLGVDRGSTSVQAVAQDGVVRAREGSPASKEDRLRQFNALFPGFQHLTLVDPEGRTLASSTYRYRGDWRGHDFFQRAKAGSRAISPAHLSPDSREPLLSFAAPVRDEADRLSAVIIGEMPVASVAALAVELRVGSGGQAFVVNSVGQVISHPDASKLMEQWDSPEADGAGSPLLFTATEEGRGYVYSVAPVAMEGMLEDWRVVLRVPASEAYAFYWRTLGLILLVSVGVLLLVALVATALGLSITRPVREVAAAARRMASGDLTSRVERPPGDELGELAASFNTMAGELQAKVLDLQESRRRIVSLQEGVRREIAQQLHGAVQNKLILLRYRVREAQKQASDGPEELRAGLRALEQDLREVQEKDLRLVTRRLYPSILRLGLVPALRSLRDQFEATLPVDMALDEGLVRQQENGRDILPEPVKLAAYRIAEEALTNVVKHAGATRVTVRVQLAAEGALHLRVQDDGGGFAPEDTPAGMGLVAMRDYAEAVGGRCLLRSEQGKGTEVSVTLPLTGSDAGSPGRGHPSG